MKPPTPESSLAPALDGRPIVVLEEAFARWQDEILGTLYCLVGNLEDARDALQETFLKCWRHADSIAEVENLKAWIFRVALNTGRDIRSTAWRRRRQSLDGEHSMYAATGASPSDAAQQTEELALVRSAVRELRPEEQEVFLLRQNGQLTYDEIAQSIGIPLNTVKTRMRLALTKLRSALVVGT